MLRIATGYAMEVAREIVKNSFVESSLDLQTLVKEINDCAISNLEKTENPELSQEQFDTIISLAVKAKLNNMIDSLLDNDFLTSAIGPDGNIIYKVTPKGVAFVDIADEKTRKTKKDLLSPVHIVACEICLN